MKRKLGFLRSQQSFDREAPGNQKLINLGQDWVGVPWSLSQADRTGATKLGRVVSWKKAFQPREHLQD